MEDSSLLESGDGRSAKDTLGRTHLTFFTQESELRQDVLSNPLCFAVFHPRAADVQFHDFLVFLHTEVSGLQPDLASLSRL